MRNSLVYTQGGHPHTHTHSHLTHRQTHRHHHSLTHLILSATHDTLVHTLTCKHTPHPSHTHMYLTLTDRPTLTSYACARLYTHMHRRSHITNTLIRAQSPEWNLWPEAEATSTLALQVGEAKSVSSLAQGSVPDPSFGLNSSGNFLNNRSLCLN